MSDRLAPRERRGRAFGEISLLRKEDGADDEKNRRVSNIKERDGAGGGGGAGTKHEETGKKTVISGKGYKKI